MKKLIFLFLVLLSFNIFSQNNTPKKPSEQAPKTQTTKKRNDFTFKSDFAQGIISSTYKKMVLKGNSVVTSNDFKLRADEIEIYGDDNSYLEARGNVYYEDYKNKMNVKSQLLFFNKKLDNFYIQKNVELEDLENQMVVKAERIEGSNKRNVYIMQYSVKIYKDETFARSENGIYKKNDKEVILEGVPVIYQDDNYYSASRIIFNTETNKYKLEGSVEGKFTQKEEEKNATKEKK